MVVDYTTVVGMIAIGIGGISSAMWGSIVTVRYRKINFKRIVIDFVNCFILSALYNKTRSLWICVMTHALINSLSQISVGGNLCVSLVCKVLIICIAVFISGGICKDNEKKS